MNTMKIEYIPQELVNQILLRLSVKDLLRFKLVCKSWCSLISSPSFITDHVEFNKKNPYYIAKFKDKISDDCNISILNHETLEVQGTYRDLPHIPNIEAGDMEIVGSCNGVVCLRYNYSIKAIILWNPATRDTKLVPTSQCFQTRVLFSTRHRIGFGFDAENNDYNVVRIHEFFKETDPIWIKIEKYSLKTDSWRLVTSSDQYVNSHLNTNYSCSDADINGMYSWLTVKKREGRHQEKIIISFNMNNDLLISTPLPISGINIAFGMNHLLAIDGSLAFIDDEYNIWKLGEYGVKESWTKIFTVPSVKVERPLGYWRNHKLFMETDGKQNLLDLVTQERSSAPIVKYWKMLQVISFRESLVRVKFSISKNLRSCDAN